MGGENEQIERVWFSKHIEPIFYLGKNKTERIWKKHCQIIYLNLMEFNNKFMIYLTSLLLLRSLYSRTPINCFVFCHITPRFSVYSQLTFGRNMSLPFLVSSNTSMLVTCPGFASHLRSLWFLTRIIFWARRWREHIPPKRRLSFNWLHGVIPQKMKFSRLHL